MSLRKPLSGPVTNWRELRDNMKIEKATKKNIGEIGKLMKEELSKPPFNENDSLKSVLKSLIFYYKNGEIYFTKEDNEIIGLLVFQIEQWWEGPVIILQDLVVKRKSQKHNVGKDLMKFIEGYAINKKVKRIYFETNKKSPAVNFYKRLGYKINKDRLSMSKKIR